MKQIIKYFAPLILGALILGLVMLGAYNRAHGQTWKPTPSSVRSTTHDVQCWGTTKAGTRCKRQINPEHPGHAIKDHGGVYYCHQHASQAK